MPHTTDPIDRLGKKLGHDALTALVRLYPAISKETDERMNAACAAMRAITKTVCSELLDDAEAAPGIGHIAYQAAVLTLANAGIQALQAG